MTARLYGIKNCDTMKKAWTWLDGHDVAYDFHGYKKADLDRATLEAWVGKVGWEVLLNRLGTTFKKLPEADRQGIDAAKAIDLMLAQPSMIKRPVLEIAGRLIVGFKPEVAAAILDVNLPDGDISPVVALLRGAGVPMILQTGVGAPAGLTARFPDLVVQIKPCTAAKLVAQLAALIANDRVTRDANNNR